MSPIMRSCLDCSKLVESPWNRCPEHRAGHDKPRYQGSATSRGYGSQHRTLRKRVLTEHLERHGLTCPGWLVSPHRVSHPSQLQLDHIIPVIDGGPGTYENSQMLCYICNRRKGASSPVAPIVSPTVNAHEQQPQSPKPRSGPFIR
jgi:5-methylcytosine-specific restriction endonuclease McrA